MKFMKKLKKQFKIGYYRTKAFLYLRKMNKAKTRDEELYYYQLFDVCSMKALSLILD